MLMFPGQVLVGGWAGSWPTAEERGTNIPRKRPEGAHWLRERTGRPSADCTASARRTNGPRHGISRARRPSARCVLLQVCARPQRVRRQRPQQESSEREGHFPLEEEGRMRGLFLSGVLSRMMSPAERAKKRERVCDNLNLSSGKSSCVDMYIWITSEV